MHFLFIFVGIVVSNELNPKQLRPRATFESGPRGKHSTLGSIFSMFAVVRNTGGATPQDATPTKYIPRTGQPEYVASTPGSEADAYRFVNYAALGYCKPQAIEQMRCKPCRYLRNDAEVIKVIDEPRTMGQAVILVDRRRSQIVLVFRGSVYLENWIQDSKTNMVSVLYAQNTKIHQGFKEAIDALMPLVIEPFKYTLTKYPNYQTVITGHSLGAALATLAASELFRNNILPWERMSLFTYGEPRSGNLAFARWINSQHTTITRVVNENDVVPHMDVAKDGYVHHSTEVYIHNGRATNCSTYEVEDIKCSLSRFPRLSIISHNLAWDVTLGITGC
ncbi:hypothetical protein DSO57_1020226 [Entomophthora muscae]|uniref:Uncharacterized protein n=1 Tax=Entomophthora muscae TaxID=34485 RepID=A0ACC2SSQ0_9FUNG|nr:hypothetical protein DSO57_1020226 [Entomophthora muscae]